MTIETEVLYNQYTADGTQTEFSFTFKVLEASHLKVLVTDTSGNVVTKTLNSDYTVTIETNNLGKITFTTAPTSQYTILIQRNVPLTQETDLQNSASGVTSLDNIEKALDKNTMIAQQQKLEINKAIKTPEGSVVTDITLPLSSANANKYIIVNSAGNGLEATDIINTTAVANLGTSIQNSEYSYAVASGSSNAYIVSFTPAVTAYQAGQRFVFKANHANTGAVTINVNGLGARAVKNIDGNDFASGAIANNIFVEVIDNGTEFRTLSITDEYYTKSEVYTKTEVNTQISTNTINRPITIANNATDSANDIDFSVGNFDFDDFSGKATATAMTKRLDANWVAGTNQGGLDANSKLANTWYHCFAIYNPTTSTADFLLSASFNSPVLPSGYTKKKYIWSVLTDSSNNISPFVQIENYNQWSLFPTDVYVNGGVANRSVRSPTGFKARVKIIVHGAESRLLLSPNFNGTTFEVGAQATGSYGGEVCSYGIPAETLTNTSSQISAGGSSRQYSAYPSYSTLGWYNPFYN